MVEVIKLLKLGSDEARVVGLWGMGGIGKTTLAKAVYNSISWQFEGCSFIENVREVINTSGILNLQERLIADILMEKDFKVQSAMHGTSIIQNKVCRKKVLIVLDDVSEGKQLEILVGELGCFKHGSRIIITTRDQHVLTVCRVQDVFNVQVLKKREAIKLFKSKAFVKNGETGEFRRLISRAVKYAKGVPLALKVLGSFLLGGTLPEWESALDRLTESPDDELQRVLQISYDELHWTEKEIFLDISCFFKGMHKDQATKILDSCGFNPVTGINVLVKKSLLTISVDKKLWMHDLVQKMGWSIVDQESRKEPGERSRLWRPDDVKHVLVENTGTKKIEGIIFHTENIQPRPDAFAKITNLRVLVISGSWTSIGLPNQLRLLSWDRYPLSCMPSTFQPEFLVELRLMNSRIEQLWDIPMVLPKLILMDLRYSTYLTKGPDFTGFPNLEYLSFEGCIALVELHPSIKILKKLMLLDLKGCISLQTLPYENNYQYPPQLTLFSSVRLNFISKSFGNLISRLNLDGTGVTDLPQSIDNSVNLHYLELSGCTKLESIPSSIGQLKRLKQLVLSGCYNLRELPEEVGFIDSLEILDVSENEFECLPASIKNLSNLERLLISECKSLQELPELPSCTKEVEASGCVSLKTICSPTVYRDARVLWFVKCPKLFRNKDINILMGYEFLLNQIKENKRRSFRGYGVPSSKIPEWIGYQNVGGSVKLHLPILDLNASNLLGFVFSAFVATKGQKCTISVHMGIGRKIFNFGNVCNFSPDSEDVIILFYPIKYFTIDEFHIGETVLEVCFVTSENHGKSGFYTSDKIPEPAPDVKECGARLIYEEEVEKYLNQ